MGSLFGKSNPYSILFILLGGLQSDVGKEQENRNNEPLYIGEVVECCQELRTTIEDYMAMPRSPSNTYRTRCILLGEFVQLLAKTLRIPKSSTISLNLTTIHMFTM